jgi:translation initiation factor 4E
VPSLWDVSLYNNIVPPSHIAVNSNYYLFKKGVKPAWEDEYAIELAGENLSNDAPRSANAKGGKWAIQVPRDKSRDSIDRWWLYTVRSDQDASLASFLIHVQMLAAIGETLEGPYTESGEEPAKDAKFTDEVTGVIVS